MTPEPMEIPAFAGMTGEGAEGDEVDALSAPIALSPPRSQAADMPVRASAREGSTKDIMQQAPHRFDKRQS